MRFTLFLRKMSRKKKDPLDELSEEVNNLSVEGGSYSEGTPVSTDRSVDNIHSKLDTSAKRKINFDHCVPRTSAQGRDDGKWLPEHPWEGQSPNRGEQMAPTVNKSKTYTLTKKWLKGDNEVDLEYIYDNLPQFIGKMTGPSSREDLKYLLNLPMPLDDKALPLSNIHPHILEIVQERRNVEPKDKLLPYKEQEKLKAYSSGHSEGSEEPNQANYYHLDCEYMLNIYLPDSFKVWFNIEDHGKRIRSVEPDENRRWIFIPSFRRAKLALMNWPEDDTITSESTIRILVVRPFEFEKYVRNHGHKFPVISLPQDEIGAGYSRFWIQKMALRLKLNFIWMIDDSIECFYEYHPNIKPLSYEMERRRPFGQVLERIEKLVKCAQQEKNPIAAMSPKNFMGGTSLENAFVCSPPRRTVFLNLRLLKKKGVYYRPELQAFEDMVFGYECEKNGLKVFIDNRIHQQDHHQWKDTGARSPSVKQQQTNAVPDRDSHADSENDANSENDSHRL